MGEMHLRDNYSDLSREGGMDPGFQFEFHCEHCNDAWRSSFVPYRRGQVSGWIGRAAGFLGGVMGEASSAVDGMAQAGYHTAHDQAFKDAMEEAVAHFHRCANCNNYVCDLCWNAQKGLCLGCAPSVEVEAERARNEGQRAAVYESAYAQGQQLAAKVDVKKDRQLMCPDCGAPTQGAKFCPECGAKLSVKASCTKCGAEFDPGPKFCPECGDRLPA